MNLSGYLDNAATACPKAPGVAEAVASCLASNCGNPGRGAHRAAIEAARTREQVRTAAARLLGGDPERTLFGPGATYWINAVLASRLGDGGTVAVSALEHNAVMRPLRRLQQTRGVEIVVVEGADGTGVPGADEFADAVRSSGARLAVATHASNVTGAVLPVERIAQAIAPVPLLVDGAQTAGAIPFDLASSGVAAFACSAHKGLLAPPGLGLLLLAPGFDIDPPVLGGTGSRSDSEQMPDHLPDRLEPGTPNLPAIAGLGAALAFLEREGADTLGDRLGRLGARLLDGLAGLSGVELVGVEPDAPRTPTVSFRVPARDLGELARALDRRHGLMLRAGLHCAPAAHLRLGTFPDGTLRASPGPFTEEAAIDRLVDALREELS
ncbi:MAG: aminotransferase class V-fold PLP-dependent enzyme [Acidobacteriota bacterium]